MANGFGSLYVGSSGLRSAQNGLNVLSNNLANVDTKGYVRQQVLFEDKSYETFRSAAVSPQRYGLGVGIGDVIHARDRFLDSAYRTEAGRAAFYSAGYDATAEVETQLQEVNGEAFKDAVSDLYHAFAEYAKDPSSTIYQNLVIQKSELFLSRATGVYDGLSDYQDTINTKIEDDVDRINELGHNIHKLSLNIQRIEAAGVETAMDLRDQRDKDLDELSKLARIDYSETEDGIVKVRIEGTEFVDEVHVYDIGLKKDPVTNFLTPYWKQLSNTVKDQYYPVFYTNNIDPALGNDIGEVKSLLLARGDTKATYLDMEGLTDFQYQKGLSKSVIMNSQAELDKLVHTIVTKTNDLLAPNTTYKDLSGSSADATGVNAKGQTVTIHSGDLVLDSDKCSLGADKNLPPAELFSRTGCSRYEEVTLTGPDGKPLLDKDGNERKVYIFNKEDPTDMSRVYTLNDITMNQDLMESPTHIPHLTQNGSVDYTLGKEIYDLWEADGSDGTEGYTLNPSDTTPTTFAGFYAKYVGELATTGSVYKTTAESLESTRDTVESNRQGVIGVSSDEELMNMIKYQNAYNASSRYINVVSQMIDYLLNSLT